MIQGPAEPNEPLELAPESAPSTHRFRTVPPPEAQEPEPEAPRPDFFTRFMDQPRWEQYTAAAALACLLGWLGASGWNQFFALGQPGGWFMTFTLIGSSDPRHTDADPPRERAWNTSATCAPCGRERCGLATERQLACFTEEPLEAQAAQIAEWLGTD